MVRDTLEACKRSGDMKENQAALKDWTVTSIQHMLRNDSPALAAHPDASISKGGQSCFAASVKEHVHKTFGLSTVPAGAAAHARRGHLHGKWCILPLPRHPQVSTRLQALYAAVCSATKEDNIAAASDDFRAPDLRTVCIVQ